MNSKAIWIDLENSPHVPFFKPIIRELERRGFTVLVTARDCFQVCGLAELHNLPVIRVGRHYGKDKLMKVFGLLWRVAQVAPLVVGRKVTLAVSHGSRTLVFLGRLLGIPTISIGDYEHSQDMPFMRPHVVMVPEVIPESAVSGIRRVIKYPGIKEDVYVPAFRPEPGFLRGMGIEEGEVVVTVRPPAIEAHYHNERSDELFTEVVRLVSSKPGTRIVLLPRSEYQETIIRAEWGELFRSRKMLIPDTVVDGLNLIWHSDLVVSGGGTMNREAAALGVPVYSIFRGKMGAVDRYLSETGRLVLLESAQDVRTKLPIEKWDRPAKPDVSRSRTLDCIVDHLVYCARHGEAGIDPLPAGR